MAGDIREYLTERFRSDAGRLRERAALLKASNKPIPGPDAALSSLMAAACDEVAAMVQLLPGDAPLSDMLVALNAVLPALNARGNDASIARTPALRAVYAGAATRVQEVIAAEARATATGSLGYVDDALDADDGDAFEDDDGLDESDDDVDDGEADEGSPRMNA